ncbi:MAG: glycosyltransferase [Xanthobacteraceae bacterium]
MAEAAGGGLSRDGSRLRVLVLAVGYPTETFPAGVFHHQQVQLMAAAGLDVTVVVPTPWVPPFLRGNPRWRKYVDVPARQVDGDVLVLRPRYLTFPRENHWFAPDLSQYLAVRRLNLQPFDVVHGFHILPLGAVARLLAKDWSVPYLTTALGDDVNVYPKLNGRNLRVLKRTVCEADRCFANGETLARETARLTGCPVENLPLGVSASRFSNLPIRHEARAKLGLPADRPVALYVGRMVPGKGIEEFATALDTLRDTRLLGVAIGSGPLLSVLENCPNAICLGARPADEVAIAMAAADLLVLPSHSEGLPTVLMEAGLAYLPIVTTDAPGCIDLADGGRALVVQVGDATGLADAIQSIAADPEGARLRAAKMRAYVESHCSVEKNTATLISYYRQLAGQPRKH